MIPEMPIKKFNEGLFVRFLTVSMGSNIGVTNLVIEVFETGTQVMYYNLTIDAYKPHVKIFQSKSR